MTVMLSVAYICQFISILLLMNVTCQDVVYKYNQSSSQPYSRVYRHSGIKVPTTEFIARRVYIHRIGSKENPNTTELVAKMHTSLVRK